jgi:hypothetical protein
MSTLAYAALTTPRTRGESGAGAGGLSPGVKTYVDALAPLVPAEVLALHAVIVTATTKTTDGKTEITAPETLAWAFVGLVVLSLGIYVGFRGVLKKWERWDWVRVLIPPSAFVAWTMLQRATAFDAVYPDMSDATRMVVALFLSVVLGIAAPMLTYKANQAPVE